MPMSPIVEYKDHRQYILDYYHDRKRRGAFTWRAFAAQAGFGSPVYLKLVCDGKKKLSADAVDRVIKAMSLSAFEAEYFRAMVAFNYAKDEDAQKAYEWYSLGAKHCSTLSTENLWRMLHAGIIERPEEEQEMLALHGARIGSKMLLAEAIRIFRDGGLAEYEEEILKYLEPAYVTIES